MPLADKRPLRPNSRHFKLTDYRPPQANLQSAPPAPQAARFIPGAGKLRNRPCVILSLQSFFSRADFAGAARFRGQRSLRDRLVSLALSALVIALIAIAVVQMGYVDLPPRFGGERLTAITVAPAAASKEKQAEEQKQDKAALPDTTAPVTPPAAVQKIVIPISKAPPAFIPISSDDFAKSDLSKLGKGSSGATSGTSGSAYGPGEGPQGQRLYKAEWVREPTQAELAGYMTERSAGARWAEIACRTIERNRVDNCQALGESPAGSGLARSLRQAAWQFQVRPPRIDGKPQVGAWVKIHFDFIHTVRDAKDDDPPADP